MSEDKNLIEIVSSIYDTILNPGAWQVAGKRIREWYSSVYAGLYVYNTNTNALVHDAIYGIDESFKNLYASTYCFIDPYRESEQFIASNPHIPLTDKRIEDIFFSIEHNHKKYDYFGDYWKRYDCDHAIGTMIDLPGNLRAGICTPRSSSIGAYTVQEIEEFEYIRHAFNQAMILSKNIQQLGDNAAALEQTIQFINQAVFIVDDKARILNVNSIGMNCLLSNHILSDNKGRLTVKHRKLNSQLLDAISLACNETISETSSISKKLTSGPVELLICPLQKEINFFKYYNPRAVVFLLQGQVSNSDVLIDLYDFTYTEKEVLRLAINGKSLIEISNYRGTSSETVKTQMRSIYGKTQTSNLKELRSLIYPITKANLV
ncbi:MAG: helix-turn-helix transcriptional regulator [Marinicella sp.]|nr:helix-turn-helix transcriptional regulator [Xanthomonadales bacterium]